MRCLVTCGPTYEPLDQVRRLTNFSTGRLGVELANFLAMKGHSVTVLQGYYSTYRKECRADLLIGFTTTSSLLLRFRELARQQFDAVFHAAAVSDFEFGKVYRRARSGALEPVSSGKYSTREGPLLAELVPTPKLIAELRLLFPSSTLVGWKYEVDGERSVALSAGMRQVIENRTDYCVVNGPAYGQGFGIVYAEGQLNDCGTPDDLYERLLSLCLGRSH